MRAAPETALDAAGIRCNVAGLTVGAIDTTSECVANAIDFLLARPDLRQAVRFALGISTTGSTIAMSAFPSG